jgi:hypothetical protein
LVDKKEVPVIEEVEERFQDAEVEIEILKLGLQKAEVS